MGSTKNIHSKKKEENCYINEHDYTHGFTYEHTHDNTSTEQALLSLSHPLWRDLR